MKKKLVVIGFLGTTLDAGGTEARWTRWRPTVSTAQHEDLRVDRMEIFTQRRFKKMYHLIEGDIAMVSPETAVRSVDLPLRDPWNFQDVFGALYDFARSYPFDVEKEEYLIQLTTGSHVAQICLFLLCESGHLPGRLLQLSPPRHRRDQGKDPGTFSIIDLDLSRYDAIAERFEVEKGDAEDFLKSGIATRNRAFNEMIGRIEQVAVGSKAPILLLGPTGAGKSRLARRIYDLKKDRAPLQGPFVEVNCGTLRGDAAMSALFGHKKGAFTGAGSDRAGLLRSADGGLLFLDEIGELGIDEQTLLLRAIEEKRFLPMGSDVEVESDFQLIAGTNRDLVDAVAEGSFRADLFARINLWLFDLPGLADRREDLRPNLDYELEAVSQELGRKVAFNKEGLEVFLKFAEDPATPWAGNFRDLHAAVLRMATLAGSKRIGPELVAEEMARLERVWSRSGEEASSSAPEAVDLVELIGEEAVTEIDRFDRVQLEEVVRVCRKSRSMAEAGRTLFAATRKRRKVTNDSDRVRKFLAKFGLDWDRASA